MALSSSRPSDDLRAAALYVQFYEQITLAWYKVRSFYTPEEDGVSTMLQYLHKNVPIIEADPKRYSSKYIYQVAFNCLYCICHDLILERERFEREVSNIVPTNDGDVDLFDLVADRDQLEAEMMRNKFWNIIYQAVGQKLSVTEQTDPSDPDSLSNYIVWDVDGRVEAVINKLMGGTSGLIAYYTGTAKHPIAFGPCPKGTKRCRVSEDMEVEVINKIRAALIKAGFGY